jgi:polyferredoxin
MLYGLATRTFTSLSVLHDRNPIFVTLADGSIRNGYSLRLVNKRPVERTFAIEVDGLPGARLETVGTGSDKGPATVVVAPDATQDLRVLVFAPAGAQLEKSTPVTFRIIDLAAGETASAQDHFKAP